MLNTIRIRSLTIFFLCFAQNAFTQQLRISDLEKEKGTVFRTIVSDSTNFILITKEYAVVNTKHFLKRYSNLQLVDKRKLASNYHENEIDYKEFSIVNDTLRAFFCISENNVFNYYLQSFDSLCFEVGEPKLLVSIPRLANKSWNNGGVLVAPDHQSYLIYCSLTAEQSNEEMFSIHLFSKEHRLLQNETIQGFKGDDDINFNDVWLRNDGKLVIAEYVFFEKLINEKKNERRMQTVRLHVFKNGTYKVLPIVPPANEYLTHFECSVEANTINAIGVYCEDEDHFKGLFTFSKEDTDTTETTVKLFPRLNSIELSAFDLRYSNRQDYPQESKAYTCNEMKLLNKFNHGDTSVFVWERISLVVLKQTYVFQSRDFLVVKLFKDSIINMAIIPKSTRGYNDDGKNIRSFVHQIDQNHLQFFFNDYSNLYENNGEYNGSSPLLKKNRDNYSPFSIVEVNMDLNTLTFTRKVRFDNTVFEVPATCGKWVKLMNGNVLLQFNKGKEFKLAYWDFK